MVPIITVPMTVTTPVVVPATADVPVATAAPVVQIVTPVGTLSDLARRPPTTRDEERQLRSGYVICQRDCNRRLQLSPNSRNLIAVQDAFDAHLEQVKELCCDQFWIIFLSVYQFSGSAINSTLAGVKKAFKKSIEPGRFPDRRTRLLEKIKKLASASIWSQVMHSYDVDLREFHLPIDSLNFQFLDPLWAWVLLARRMDARDLHWRPSPTAAQPKYGNGVQCGKAFLSAFRSCPAGGYPMLMTLHWDGTSAHGLDSAPIMVGLANTNVGDGEKTQFCVGYMPRLPKSVTLSEDNATKIKHYIRQQCASTILTVMQSVAVHGVKVRLLNTRGSEVTRVLFPRLFAMNFDQPEAQLFYGIMNRTCCTKCKKRKGYSAFRTGSKQRRHEIQRLYNISADNASPLKTIAQQKLCRWGFNFTRRCCLLSDDFDDLLVKVPDYIDEVFPCVDYRDRMHGLLIFIHRSVMESLQIIPFTAAQKRLLDRRLSLLHFCFRDSKTNTCYRKQRSIFADTNTTAVDKVCILFLLPHVFGHKAEMMPAGVRTPLLTAIAYAQLLVIAVRGLRAYTVDELKVIFDDGYKLLFGALESVYHTIYRAKEVAHRRDPSQPLPKRFKREVRTYERHSALPSDTDSTSDDSDIGGLGKYSHGGIGLVHQHWVTQVVCAGSFGVHCTEAAEAYHKVCMHRASQRVKHVARDNLTQLSMVRYLQMDFMFKTLQERYYPVVTTGKVNVRVGVQSVFQVWEHVDFMDVIFQGKVLHPHARVTHVELLDLVCDHLHLPRTRDSYSKLSRLNWMFGQKLTRKDGRVYWATDNAYGRNIACGGRRRDVLHIHGSERVNRRRNALACECLCFFSITGLQQLMVHEPHDTLTFVLARWLTPHSTSVERDSQNRPVCPGVLTINHALWEYAVTQRTRRSLLDRHGNPTNSFVTYRAYFGKTRAEQVTRLERESRAYFGLVQPQNILRTMNIHPEYTYNGDALDVSCWLESVVMI